MKNNLLSQNFVIRHILPIMGRKGNRNEMFKRVLNGLHQAQSDGTLDDGLRQMVDFIGLSELLPPEYARFKPMLIEGMHFLLGQLPLERLAWKIVDQVNLAPGTSKGERITTLINDMPTLQKLGQVIGRHPQIKPSFKLALIELEDNVNTLSYADLQPEIEARIEQTESAKTRGHLKVHPVILSEASVCAVIPAEIRDAACGTDGAAVVKIVKPAVRQNLAAELDMLDRLAAFLDRNQHKWNSGDLKFKDTLDRVCWMIHNEVDLAIEQANLRQARRYYRHQKYIGIPFLYACSTPEMTVMSRLDGRKITDVAHLDAAQKRKLASLVADICIVKPLQDLRTETMFHGDPHAGNIAYRFDGPEPRIFLYDWGMMGRLNRLERFAFGLMAAGILTDSAETIVFAIDLLSPDTPQKKIDRRFCYEAVVRVLVRNQRPRKRGMLSMTGEIFEELTCIGLVFPPNILLFGKAMVTLNGVLSDIDATFNRDDYVIGAVMRKFYGNMASLRLHWFWLKQTWLFYGYGLEKLFELQRFIWRTAARFGWAGNFL